MIHIVQKALSEGWGEYITAMHRLRAEVFHERLGWDVSVSDGMEVDEFDDLNPVYLLSVGQSGELQGSMRLLPTTGPNMLQDVFPQLLGEHGSVRCPLIWEASRFCVATDKAKNWGPSGVNRVTGELLAGLFEVASAIGLQSIVAVHDARFKRILSRSGWPETVIGEPQAIGNVRAYAGLFPIEPGVLQNLQRIAGARGSVLCDEVSSELFAA